MYRIDSVTQPNLDASILPAALRGVFNHWSWAQADGRAYMMDRLGCYVFDHSRATPIGDAINNYFREGLIDFANADKFHVSANRRTKVIRFHIALLARTTLAIIQCGHLPILTARTHGGLNATRGAFAALAHSRNRTAASNIICSLTAILRTTRVRQRVRLLGNAGSRSNHSITNTVADANDYTCRLGIAGIDSSYLGCPIAFTSGTGKGVYGIITGEQSTDVYNARLLTVVSLCRYCGWR